MSGCALTFLDLMDCKILFFFFCEVVKLDAYILFFSSLINSLNPELF